MRFNLAQVACVAAAAVGCWHFLLEPVLLPDQAVYTTASSTNDQHILQIGFVESASVADISSMLHNVEGTIVDGPSAIGLYRVRFAGDAARDAAAKLLGDRSDLIAEVSKR